MILGSGSAGITSETAGDQLGLAVRIRCCVTCGHMCCTTGTAKHMGEIDVSTCVHAANADLYRIPDVFSALWGKGRGILLMHLSLSYLLCGTKACSAETSRIPLSFPDLVYLIDFHPAGHLYNT